jgi:hypothetical protein
MIRILLPMLCALFLSSPAHAKTHTFLFWYPGEAGTTAQAQPLMDLFASYLDKKMPETKWRAQYFSVIDRGKTCIRGNKPVMGVVSNVMYWRFRHALGMEHVAATRPLPHGKTRESWFLVHGPCTQKNPVRSTFVTEPLTPALLREHFSSDVPWKIAQTHNLLGRLKTMATGDCHLAVVGERVWSTITRLKTQWSTALTATPSLKTHPTPSLVKFRHTEPKVADALLRVLRDMSADPEGKAILSELQLVGF